MSDKSTQKRSEGNRATSDLSRHKNFCFTSYKTQKPEFSEETMKYMCFGEELCPKTNRKHWQGFVCWKNAKTLSACHKQLDLNTEEKGWVQVIKGTLKQNEDYCTKEGKYETHGILPNQGERKDLECLKDEIMEHKITVDEIIVEDPEIYHQYGRTLEKLEDIAQRKKYRTEMTEGEWIHGPTGTGKSHIAFENYDPNTHYVLPNDNGWWDGYKGQEIVIINDFRGEIPYNQLLQIVDKWPFSVKRRNREPMPFISKKVIITSSLSPDKIYHNRMDEDKIEQLLRRFKIINTKIEDENDISIRHLKE